MLVCVKSLWASREQRTVNPSFKPMTVFHTSILGKLGKLGVCNSHSLDIPTPKHFCRRQYWQRFLVTLLIMQFLSRWHVYTMFFWMLRRKKPWGNRQRGRGGGGGSWKGDSHDVNLIFLLIFCSGLFSPTSTRLHWNSPATGYHNVTTACRTMCWMFCLFIAIKAERRERRWVPAGSCAQLQMLDLSSETESEEPQGITQRGCCCCWMKNNWGLGFSCGRLKVTFNTKHTSLSQAFIVIQKSSSTVIGLN